MCTNCQVFASLPERLKFSMLDNLVMIVNVPTHFELTAYHAAIIRPKKKMFILFVLIASLIMKYPETRGIISTVAGKCYQGF